VTGNTHSDASRRAGSAGVSAALPEFYMAEGRDLRPKASPASHARRQVGTYAAQPTKEVLPTDVIDLPRELLKVGEAAGFLRIGRTKVYELIARGELPVTRIGRAVRIPRRGLLKWIEAQTTGGHDLGRSA